MNFFGIIRSEIVFHDKMLLKKLFASWHLAASSNIPEISILYSFCVIWHRKKIFYNFLIRMAKYINILYPQIKISWWIMIITKCHAFYDCENLKKLQSEIFLNLATERNFTVKKLFSNFAWAYLAVLEVNRYKSQLWF